MCFRTGKSSRHREDLQYNEDFAKITTENVRGQNNNLSRKQRKSKSDCKQQWDVIRFFIFDRDFVGMGWIPQNYHKSRKPLYIDSTCDLLPRRLDSGCY